MTQATNLYVYCGNNPLILVDPSGKVFMLATGLVGAVAGGIAGAIYSLRASDGRGVSWRHVAAGVAIGGAIGLTGGAAASLVVTAGKTPLATLGTIISGAAVAPPPYLQKVSDAAYAAADRVGEYTVKSYHLLNGSGEKSKFLTSSMTQVRAWLQQALRSPDALFLPNGSSPDSIQVFIDFGHAIGTKGQRMIKIVVDETGRIITTYPVGRLPWR